MSSADNTDRVINSVPAAARHGPARIGFDADNAGAGLGQLVFAILEIIRQLLERQAVRRVEAGSLTDEEIERLGCALLALEERFASLRDVFGVGAADLRVPVNLEELLTAEAGPGPGRETGGRS